MAYMILQLLTRLYVEIDVHLWEFSNLVLFGWQHICQPNRNHDGKHLLTNVNMEFFLAIQAPSSS